MAWLHTEVVDQLVVLYGVTLVEDVFVDRSRRADVAFAGYLIEQLAQLLFLQRGGMGNGQGEAQGEQGGQTIHGGLLMTALVRPAGRGPVHSSAMPPPCSRW